MPSLLPADSTVYSTWDLFAHLICPPPDTCADIAMRILSVSEVSYPASKREKKNDDDAGKQLAYLEMLPRNGWMTQAILEAFFRQGSDFPFSTLRYDLLVPLDDVADTDSDSENGSKILHGATASLADRRVFPDDGTFKWDEERRVFSKTIQKGERMAIVTMHPVDWKEEAKKDREEIFNQHLSYDSGRSKNSDNRFDAVLAFFAFPKFPNDWRKFLFALHKRIYRATGKMHYAEVAGDSAGWFYSFDSIDLSDLDLVSKQAVQQPFETSGKVHWERMLYLLAMRRFHWACKIEGWHAERPVSEARHEPIGQALSRYPWPMRAFSLNPAHPNLRYQDFEYGSESTLEEWIEAICPLAGEPAIATIAPPQRHRKKIRERFRDEMLNTPFGQDENSRSRLSLPAYLNAMAQKVNNNDSDVVAVDNVAGAVRFKVINRFRLITQHLPKSHEDIRIESSIANRLDQEFGASFTVPSTHKIGPETSDEKVVKNVKALGLYQIMNFNILPDPALTLMTNSADISRSGNSVAEEYDFSARIPEQDLPEQDGRAMELCFKTLIKQLLNPSDADDASVKNSDQALIHTFPDYLPERIIINIDNLGRLDQLYGCDARAKDEEAIAASIRELKSKPSVQIKLRSNGAVHLLHIRIPENAIDKRFQVAVTQYLYNIFPFVNSELHDVAGHSIFASRDLENLQKGDEIRQLCQDACQQVRDIGEWLNKEVLNSIVEQLGRIFLTLAVFRENALWWILSKEKARLEMFAREMLFLAAMPVTRVCFIPSRDAREGGTAHDCTSSTNKSSVLCEEKRELSVGSLVINYDHRFDPDVGPVHPTTELRLQNAIGLRNRTLHQVSEKQRQTNAFLSASLVLAITRVMMRNMSHNLGSHILPRSGSGTLMRRLEDWVAVLKSKGLEVDDDLRLQKNQMVVYLMESLHDYMGQKEEFISQLTADKSVNTRPAWFYRDVILPFVENTLIVDNIAANEDFRHTPLMPKEKRISVRVFICPQNGVRQELSARYMYKVPEINTTEYNYPPEKEESNPIYTLRHPDLTNIGISAFHERYIVAFSEQNRVRSPQKWDADFEVELPGQQGQFAFYSFLENYIRNAAKHGARDQPHSDLEVFIEVGTGNAKEGEEGYYTVRIYNSLHAYNQEDKQKFEQLQKDLTPHLTDPITDEKNDLRSSGWGIAEMRICALLLKGAAKDEDFAELRTATDIAKTELKLLPWDETQERLVDDSGAKKRYLTYQLRLMRPKRALILDGQKSKKSALDAEKATSVQLSRFGFEIVKVAIAKDNIEAQRVTERVRTLITNDIEGASFRFAVLSLPLARAVGEGLTRIRHLIPFRLMLLPTSSEERLGKEWLRPVLVIAADVQKQLMRTAWDVRGGNDDPARLGILLWQYWLAYWQRDAEGVPLAHSRPIYISLYLDQEATVPPTKEWIAYADEFNKQQQERKDNLPRVYLQIFSKDEDISQPVLSTIELTDNTPAYLEAVFDRHGKMAELLPTLESTRSDENRRFMYQTLDKITPDMGLLFSPVFPDDLSGAEQGKSFFPWTLPYEIAEASLLRVLIIDERAPDLSFNSLSEERESPLWAQPNEWQGDTETVWNQAYAAGVYIATSVRIVSHKDEQDGEQQDKWLYNKEQAGVNGEISSVQSLKVELNWNESKIKYTLSGRECSLNPDIVIVHQGLFDGDKDRYGTDGAHLLNKLREVIPWVVVTSGRGLAQMVNAAEKYVPFSLVKDLLLNGTMGKLTFTRNAMQMRRRDKSE